MNNTYEIYNPEPVGYWQISPGAFGTWFPMYQKPTNEQIKNTEELLGWKWIDKET